MTVAKKSISEAATSEAAANGEVPGSGEQESSSEESTSKKEKKAPAKKASSKSDTKPKTVEELRAENEKAASKTMDRITSKLKGRMMFAPREEEFGFPSGCDVLDYVLGPDDTDRKGYAAGRIVELHGWESTAKTTLAITACVEAQKAGIVPMFVDFEHAYVKKYAEDLGLDTSEEAFHYIAPMTIEEAAYAIEEVLKDGTMPLIVIDSATAMLPKTQYRDHDQNREGGRGRQQGQQASLLSEMLSKWSKMADPANTAIVFTNQMRAKPGAPDPEQAAAGNALKFYCSQRVKLQLVTKEKVERRNPFTGELEEVEDAIIVRAHCVKNKVGKPWKKAEFRVVFGKGVDNLYSRVKAAKANDIIETAGSWFTYHGTTESLDFRVQGNDALEQAFRDSPTLMEDLRVRVMEVMEKLG